MLCVRGFFVGNIHDQDVLRDVWQLGNERKRTNAKTPRSYFKRSNSL